MSTSCVRVAKIKTKGHLAAAMGHNTRDRDTPNADPDGVVKALVPAPLDAGQRVDELIGKQTVRKNAVIATEIVLTTSPEFFRPGRADQHGVYDQKPTEEWAKASTAWLNERFKGRIVSAHLHLDERTPHIHAVIVPLDERGRLSHAALFAGGDYKGQKLSDLQTEYADALAHLGIERGMRGTKAKHQTIKHYHGEMAKPDAVLPAIKTVKVQQVVKVETGWLKDDIQTQTVSYASGPSVLELEKAAKDLQAKAKLAALNAKENKALKVANAHLTTQLEQAKRTITEFDKQEMARLRPLPMREVLAELYDAKMTEPGVYLANGKKVALDKEAGTARVAGGRLHKSAVDLVREIEGFSNDGEGAILAATKLAEAFPADKIARDTLNSNTLQAALVQRVTEAEKVSKENGTHRSKRRGHATGSERA